MQQPQSKNSLQKLNHPIFITFLGLLIINDWFLKPIYGNWLTGKLSDFAGLFAFAFFISAVMNKERWNLTIHILIGVGFIFWKCPISTPLIAFFNSLKIPVSRIIDVTDLVALIAIPFSLMLIKQPGNFESGRLRIRVIALISLSAFVATSLPPPQVHEYDSINKLYSFDLSKETLVAKWNEVHLQNTRKQSELYREFLEFDSVKNVFRFRNSGDTVAYFIRSNQQDTIRYNGYFVGIKICGNEKRSELNLLYLKTFEQVGIFSLGRSKSSRRVLKEFEELVIEKIKRE